MKSCKKGFLAVLTIIGLGLAQQSIALAMPAIIDRSLKAISAKSQPYIDTAKQLLFSNSVQKIAATMDRFAYLRPETAPIKMNLFGGFFVGAPLGAFLGQYIVATLNNEKYVSPVGLIMAATSTAYLWACIGTLKYTEAAINHLKEKIKQKQPLSAYEVHRAIELSLHYYAYRRGKIKNYDRIKYNFYDPAVWDHPQLNTNKKLIEGFVQCFEHTPWSCFCPTNYTVITAIINEYPALVKKIKTDGKNYLNNDLFGDLLTKRYIEEYMQAEELDTIIDIVLSYDFPHTLRLYAQPPYLQMLQKCIQQDSYSIADIGKIDKLLTKIPALTNTLKEKCLHTCPTDLGWPYSINNKAFFKEIFVHHLTQGTAHICTEIIKTLNDTELKRLDRTITQKKVSMLLPDARHQLTGPTKRYLDRYPHRVRKKFDKELVNETLQRLSHEVITIESQEAHRGHFTFLHGEPKEMHPLQYWFTKLYEIKNHVTVNNYIFTRFIHDTGLLNQLAHLGTRIQNGDHGNRTDVFMGHCLYSNSGGACAGDYYLRNRAIHSFKESIKNIFKRFGYAAIYNRYRNELKALEKEYQSICPYGQLLLFSFSETALKKSVYVSHPGWKKRSVTITNKKHGTSITTDDIVTVVRAMRDTVESIQDYENLEFCFIPTIDYGLHPDIAGKEIRIFNLTGADPEKMKAYLEKEQALLATITAAIRAQEAAQPSLITHAQQAIYASVFKNNNATAKA